MAKKLSTSWSPEALHQHLERNSRFAMLDVRNRDEFEVWKIEGKTPVPTINMPYFELLDLSDDSEEIAAAVARAVPLRLKDRLPRSGPILVVCAQGDTSSHVAEGLRRLDYQAFNLEGGMAAWGNHYEMRVVEESPQLTILQISRPARGCLSYLVASGGEAMAIDASRHIEVYKRIADDRGWRIGYVIDSHLQADHLSGGVALAEDRGAEYWLHPYDSIHPDDLLPARFFSFQYLKDAVTFPLGTVSVSAMHLPGHTLGMTNLLVDERFLLSGDTLFIDSIGRPDLGGRAKGWTPLLYHSLLRLTTLHDDTVVLPAHFSHMREADDQGCYRAKLSALRSRNEGLRMLFKGAAEFGAYILGSLPEHPPVYDDIRRVNTGLLQVDEAKASELELGRNRCALAHDQPERV